MTNTGGAARDGDDVQLVRARRSLVAHGRDEPFLITPNDTPKNTAITIIRSGWHRAPRTFLMARGGRGYFCALKWTKHPMLIQGKQGYDHLRRVDGQQADDQVRYGCEQQRLRL